MNRLEKYRKKPVVIEAVQYVEYGRLVKGMCNSRSCYSDGNHEPHVHTIHNNQIVLLEVGDFIIPEPDGEHYYPCKPDIFEQTYERINTRLTQEDKGLEELIRDTARCILVKGKTKSGDMVSVSPHRLTKAIRQHYIKLDREKIEKIKAELKDSYCKQCGIKNIRECGDGTNFICVARKKQAELYAIADALTDNG